jgi:tRNA-guanine family transglycosylase
VAQPEQQFRLTFGKYRLLSPTFFASYRYGDYPVAGLKSHPWAVTETEALLINAFDFQRPKYQPLINNGWSPAKHLNFSEKPILIDSGAYYFRKDENIDVTPLDVLDIQAKSKADIAVVLDHPFPPEAVDKARRIRTTVRNTEKMLVGRTMLANAPELMPVVHGHTRRAARGCIQQLTRVYEKHRVALLRVGIGSLAPLAQRGSPVIPVEIISEVRERLPNAHIHCFSMGSALLMLLAFYAGADTVDSQSWILSAAFKYAQLPGHYVVRMGRKDYATWRAFRAALKRFADRLIKLAQDEGFYVKNWSNGERIDLTCSTSCEEYVQSLVDKQSNEHIHNRACHNLWVYNWEVRRYRQEQSNGKLQEFLSNRLLNTRYADAFRRAQQIKKST